MNIVTTIESMNSIYSYIYICFPFTYTNILLDVLRSMGSIYTVPNGSMEIRSYRPLEPANPNDQSEETTEATIKSRFCTAKLRRRDGWWLNALLSEYGEFVGFFLTKTSRLFG